MPPINDRVMSRRYGQSCPSLGLNEYRKKPEMYGGTCRVNLKQPYVTAFLNLHRGELRGARPHALAIGADQPKETAGTERQLPSRLPNAILDMVLRGAALPALR